MACVRRYELHFPGATRIVSTTTRLAGTYVRLDVPIDASELPDEFTPSTFGGVVCGMIVPNILMHSTTISTEPASGGLHMVVVQQPASMD